MHAMTLAEWDLWAAASQTLRLHKENAVAFAERHAVTLLEAGDENGALIWIAIAVRIERLDPAGDSDTLH